MRSRSDKENKRKLINRNGRIGKIIEFVTEKRDFTLFSFDINRRNLLSVKYSSRICRWIVIEIYEDFNIFTFATRCLHLITLFFIYFC